MIPSLPRQRDRRAIAIAQFNARIRREQADARHGRFRPLSGGGHRITHGFWGGEGQLVIIAAGQRMGQKIGRGGDRVRRGR